MKQQIHYGKSSPKWWKINPIKNGNLWCKPYGGFWTSTFKNLGQWTSDWHEQGSMMFGYLGDACLLTPEQNVKYRVIDNYKDLETLWHQYYYESETAVSWHKKLAKDFASTVTFTDNATGITETSTHVPSFIEDFFNPIEFNRTRYPFDFEAYFKDYDALQLTEWGQCRTRMSRPLDFYGWDSEATLWGSWKFKKVIPIPVGSHIYKRNLVIG